MPKQQNENIFSPRDFIQEISKSNHRQFSTFYSMNSDGVYDSFGQDVKKLTGYSSSELIDKGFNSIVKQQIKRKGKEEDNKYQIYTIETKTGEEKIIEDIRFTDPKKLSTNIEACGILRDVTELFNYFQDLNDTVFKLEKIFEIGQVIFVVIDKNDKINLINKNGCEILGVKLKDVVGKSWQKFISGNVVSEIKEFTSKAFMNETEPVESYEMQLKTGNGKIIDTIWNNAILKDSEGKVRYIIASGKDITEQKRDDKLKTVISEILEASNSAKNLDDLFKFIHQSIAYLMKVDNFYIALYEKENNLIHFPYFVDEIDKEAPPKRFGKGLTEYVIRQGTPELINKEMDEKLAREGETELMGAQSEIWLGVPLKIQDNTIGVMALQDYKDESTYSENDKRILDLISYPISRAIERKRVEQEKNELITKLQELNASKDKLFSLISHDLRSPFNSLLGFSEILKTEYDTLTTDEIKEYLNVIYETSNNLFQMTNNLLQYSRFQMGRFDYKPKRLNLVKTIEKNISILRANILKKQLNFSTDLELNALVFVDEDMLTSVLQNLISNAIKFTDRDGDIKISTGQKKYFKNKNMIEIIVQDSGVGMESSKLNKIFKSTIKSSPGTEREYGTGLGLLLVKEFIEKMGGEIKVESQLNVGSTFVFTIPYEELINNPV